MVGQKDNIYGSTRGKVICQQMERQNALKENTGKEGIVEEHVIDHGLMGSQNLFSPTVLCHITGQFTKAVATGNYSFNQLLIFKCINDRLP